MQPSPIEKSWADAHLHLSDSRWTLEEVGHLIQEAQSLGVGLFSLGGVDPLDWERQIELKKLYPNLVLCFGLHPYKISGWSEVEIENHLNLLARQIEKHKPGLIGEVGLDFRSQHLGEKSEENRAKQIQVAEDQIELALFKNKPIVFHFVRCDEESLQLLDRFTEEKIKGFVHAFNKNLKIAQAYLERGLFLSVGGAVTHTRNEDLRRAIKEIPLESLLIETDSPDQKPMGWLKPLNQPGSLIQVAETIAELKSVNPLEVLEITSQNFKNLTLF